MRRVVVDAEEVWCSLDALYPVVVELFEAGFGQALGRALLGDVLDHDGREAAFLCEDRVSEPSELKEKESMIKF